MKHYTGMQYLKIDIANHFGLDREQFSTRIQWVDDHEDTLESFQPAAKSPFEYATAVMAYRDTQTGKPIGYLVGLDAAASGPQLMSTLTGCEVGARNTGLIGKTRNDIYTITANAINDILDADMEYDRNIIKKALMPSYYASKKAPKRVFGEDTPELDAFYKAQKKVAPGATALMPIMLDAWQSFELNHSWFLPDGFFVKKPVTEMMDAKIEVDELGHTSFIYRYEKNQGLEHDLSLPADLIQSCDALVVRELARRCNFDPKQLMIAETLLQQRIDEQDNFEPKDPAEICKLAETHNFISLVGIEYIGEVKNFPILYCHKLLQLVQRTLQHPPFEVVMIHDNFKCHPNYMNHVRQVYIDIFAEIAESSILNAILTDITGIPTTVKKLSTDLGNLIRQSEYAIT